LIQKRDAGSPALTASSRVGHTRFLLRRWVALQNS
jgi:hypothetical protein